jgi:hypothetical protein
MRCEKHARLLKNSFQTARGSTTAGRSNVELKAWVNRKLL